MTLSIAMLGAFLTACPAPIKEDPVEEPDSSPELPILPTPDTPAPSTSPEPKEPDPLEPETPEPDAGTPDTPSPDAGTPDTPTPDAGPAPSDAGTPDAGEPDVDGGSTPVDDCGDNTRTGDEVCDGTDVSLSCRDVGFGGGSIGCKNSCDDVETAGCTALAVTPIAAPGASITLTDFLENSDPTFTRPSATCGTGFSAGFFFDAFAIQNTSAVQQELTLTAAWPDDGFLLVYTTPFDPRSVTGCFTGNDDGTGTGDSIISALTIAPGQTLVVVASAYSTANAMGEFSIDIATTAVDVSGTCPNNILDTGEACDGTAFGTATCATYGFDQGTLSCSVDCQTIDSSGCSNLPPPPPTAIATPGSSITLNGSLTSTDDGYVTVNESCEARSNNADHYYDAIAIINNTGADQRITMTATWTTGDGILSLHSDPFDPLAPATSCIDAGDDFNGTGQSKVTSALVAAGETLWVVPTTYGSMLEIANYTVLVETDSLSECGDNATEGDEICDGTDLNGATCASAGFSAGTVGCAAACNSLELLGCYSPQGPVDVPNGGASDTFTGALNASDTHFDRPGLACASGSGQADHAYDVWEVRNTFGDARTIIINGAFTGGTGSLLRYSDFDPTTPTTGCVTFTGTSLGSLTLAANESAWIVVAAASGGSTVTSYTITVTADTVPICGDDVVNSNEVCDGTAFGAASCIGQGFDGGGLGCAANCMSVVTDQCFAFASTTSIAGAGGSVTLSGSIDVTDPVYDRPLANCAASTLYDEHFFDAFVVENNTGFAQVVNVTAAWSGDGYLHVYDVFDSVDPLIGCTIGDDDYLVDGSQIVDLFMPAGARIVVVASTFREEAIGAYDIVINTQQDPPLPLRTEPGLAVQLRGSISAASDTWRRAVASCDNITSLTGPMRFEKFRVENTSATDLVVTLTAHWQDDDGFLFLYDENFDEAAALVGCIAGDDDFTENTESLSSRRGSRISKVTIPAGATRTVVASSYDDTPSAIGAFSIDVLTNAAAGVEPVIIPIAAIGASKTTVGTVGLASPTWDSPDTCSYVDTPANTSTQLFYQSQFIVENTLGVEVDLNIIVNWLDASADGSVWAFVYTPGTDPTAVGGKCIGQNDDTTGPEFSFLTTYILPDEVIVIVPSSETDGNAPGGYLLDVATEASP